MLTQPLVVILVISV